MCHPSLKAFPVQKCLTSVKEGQEGGWMEGGWMSFGSSNNCIGMYDSSGSWGWIDPKIE